MASFMQRLRAMVRPRSDNPQAPGSLDSIPEKFQEQMSVIICAVENVFYCGDKEVSEAALRGMTLVKEISGNSALDQERIGDLIANKTNFCSMFANCWSRKALRNVLDSGQGGSLNKQQERRFEFYRALAGTCWNYTDESEVFCRKLDAEGAIAILVDWLLSLNDRKNLNKWAMEITFGVMNILHNVCRKMDEIGRVYARVVPALEKLATSDDPIIKACSFLTLSYFIQKDEADKLTINEACVTTLLKLTKDAMENLEHRIRIQRETGVDAFRRTFTLSAVELAQGLEQLTINDSNKRLVGNHGGVAVFARMLEMDCTAEEKAHAANVLWQLAFHRVNRDALRGSPDIIRELIQLSGSDNPELRSACMGALFEIYDSKLPEDVSETSESKGSACVAPSGDEDPKPGSHIMISYKWEQPSKSVMREFKDQLKQKGYRVWMDEEQMAGDMIEKMASAVENADVILACITQGYQESKNCRTEATYAYDCNKKIIPVKVSDKFRATGWLGGITAGKIYYLVPEVERVSEELPRIIELEIEKSQEKPAAPSSPVTDSKSTAEAGAESTGDGVTKWGKDEVKDWLGTNGVTQDNACLNSLRGVQLLQLKKQLSTAPESFYQSMKEDLKIPYIDVLSLAAALEAL